MAGEAMSATSLVIRAQAGENMGKPLPMRRSLGARLVKKAWEESAAPRVPSVAFTALSRWCYRLTSLQSAIVAARMPEVDLGRNLAFIHVPKNAGTSIVSSLGLRGSTHSYAELILPPLTRFFPDIRSIAVVRNPFDRFVSLYEYARMRESYYHSSSNPDSAIYGMHRDYPLLKEASFDQCVDLLLAGKLKNGWPAVMWQPQTKWLCDRNGKCLVTHVARFESLGDDLVRICRALSLPEPELGRLNCSSRNANYRSYYSDYARRVVSAYYQSDCELLGYAF